MTRILVTAYLLIALGLAGMFAGGYLAHPSPVKSVTVHVTESTVVLEVPVTWHGMQCLKQVDTNGNIWINDCTRDGS